MSTSSVISLVILWMLPSLIVAYFGSDRKIGYTNSLLISVIFTPVIGILAVLLSGKAATISKEVKTANRSVSKGLKFMEEKNYQTATKFFKEAIISDPSSEVAYYNLACAYSKLQYLDDAFHYLILAIRSGYNNFEKIKSDPDLADLIKTSHFKEFEKNGYQHKEKPSHMVNSAVELEKLFELKEKGIISEEEFSTMKGKLLS